MSEFSNIEFLTAAFEEAAIGMGIVSLDLKFLKVNQKFCDITGYLKEELLDLTVADITHPEDMEENKRNDAKVSDPHSGERSFKMRKRYIRKDKSTVWVSLTVTVICDEKGYPIYYISQVEDIDDHLRMEAELLTSIENVQRQSTFISQLSHEVRSPLGALIGYTELSLETEALEEKVEIEGRILEISKTLKEILNNTLDYFKLSEGKMELNLSEFNLIETVQYVVDSLEVSFQENKNQVELIIEGSKPNNISSDETKIKQILINLLSNANRYTQSASIKIRIHFSKSISIRVEDEGCGIPPEFQNTIFDSYKQVASQSKGGTGLGLSIVKELSHMIGTGVSLVESSSQGSIFEFFVDNHMHNPKHSKAA